MDTRLAHVPALPAAKLPHCCAMGVPVLHALQYLYSTLHTDTARGQEQLRPRPFSTTLARNTAYKDDLGHCDVASCVGKSLGRSKYALRIGGGTTDCKSIGLHRACVCCPWHSFRLCPVEACEEWQILGVHHSLWLFPPSTC